MRMFNSMHHVWINNSTKLKQKHLPFKALEANLMQVFSL